MVAALLKRLLPLALFAFATPTLCALESPGRVAALESLHIDDEVAGDVFVLAGDLDLGPQARVHGHAIALFGSITLAPGAQVEGRILAVRSLASLQLESDGVTASARLDAAVRLLSSGGWLLVTTGLAALFPAAARRGYRVTRHAGWRIPVLGLLLIATFFAALVAALGLGPSLGSALAAALFMLFLVLKAFGLAVCGGLLGRWLLRFRVRRPLPPSFGAFVGVSCFLLLRLVPLVGGALWSLISIVALGAGLLTLAAGRGLLAQLSPRVTPPLR